MHINQKNHNRTHQFNVMPVATRRTSSSPVHVTVCADVCPPELQQQIPLHDWRYNSQVTRTYTNTQTPRSKLDQRSKLHSNTSWKRSPDQKPRGSAQTHVKKYLTRKAIATTSQLSQKTPRSESNQTNPLMQNNLLPRALTQPLRRAIDPSLQIQTKHACKLRWSQQIRTR